MCNSRMIKQIVLCVFLAGFANIAQAKSKTAFFNHHEYEYAKNVVPNVRSDVVIEKPKFLSIIDTNESMFHSDKDIFCMAKNIYHEAATESKLGKYAVAQVTLNRMKNPMYPKDLCSVVFDPLQFSWASDTKTRWARPSGPDWEESKQVAQDVVVSGKRVQGMDKALFFHSDSINPIWANAKRKIARIGSHIFYRSMH